MYARYLDLLLRHPILAILATVTITVLLGAQIPRIEVDPEMDALIPPGSDARGNLDELEEIFGHSFLTRIIITRDDHPDGIYNPDTLALLAEITAWIEQRPEFETLRSSDLRSLTTVKNITGDDTGMVVQPFMEQPPETRDGAARLRRDLEDNGMYVGVLVAADGSAASIMVRESDLGRAKRAEIYRTINDYLDGLRAAGHPERFHVSGRTIVEGLFGLYLSQEARRMMPFVVALLGAVLFLSFRTVRGVLIPVSVLACTEAWMLGFLGLIGWHYYSITSILPVLLTAIAIADSIHLLARYYEAQTKAPAASRTEIVRLTMHEMGPPVLMTTVTTAVGFLSMATSPVLPLAQFGIAMAVGIVAAFVLTLVLIPAVLVLLPLDGPRRPSGSHGGNSLLEQLLVPPALFADRRPYVILGAFGLLAAIACVGLTGLSTDTSQIKQFKPGHHLREADRIDNERFAGATILDIMIDGLDTDAMKNPEMLARIDRLQSEMEELDVVGDTFSIVELVKRMNRVMNEDRPEADAVPTSRELIAQYLLLYAISGDPGDFDDLVDYDYRYAHVFVFVSDSGTRASSRVVARARELAQELFPPTDGPQAVVKLAGSSYSNATLEGYVIQSQISTLYVCMPSIFLLSLLMFRRLALAALTITPVALSIAVIYGAMGFSRLPTDIATVMLGAMSLGTGVDFAIHYLYRYTAARRAGADTATAAAITARTAGRALFYNALVLIGGFATLLAARFYPQMKLGALVSTTMLLCYISTMLLFPAGLRLTDRGRARLARSPLRDAASGG